MLMFKNPACPGCGAGQQKIVFPIIITKMSLDYHFVTYLFKSNYPAVYSLPLLHKQSTESKHKQTQQQKATL